MTRNNSKSKLERIREIEDRKIELLIETEKVSKEYSKKITELQAEYKKLDKEHYYLQLEQIKLKQLKKKSI